MIIGVNIQKQTDWNYGFSSFISQHAFLKTLNESRQPLCGTS
jgi:hypothetical protein